VLLLQHTAVFAVRRSNCCLAGPHRLRKRKPYDTTGRSHRMQPGCDHRPHCGKHSTTPETLWLAVWHLPHGAAVEMAASAPMSGTTPGDFASRLRALIGSCRATATLQTPMHRRLSRMRSVAAEHLITASRHRIDGTSRSPLCRCCST